MGLSFQLRLFVSVILVIVRLYVGIKCGLSLSLYLLDIYDLCFCDYHLISE